MALPVAVAGAGIGLQAYGMYMQGQQAAQAGAMAKMSDYYEASQVEKQGQQQVEYLQRQSTRTQGRNTTNAASAGLDVSSGSPALAILDQVTQDQKAIAITKSNAEHKALALRMAGDQSVLLGNQREQAANIGAAGGLLTSGAKLYDMQRGGSSGGVDTSNYFGDSSSNPY